METAVYFCGGRLSTEPKALSVLWKSSQTAAEIYSESNFVEAPESVAETSCLSRSACPTLRLSSKHLFCNPSFVGKIVWLAPEWLKLFELELSYFDWAWEVGMEDRGALVLACLLSLDSISVKKCILSARVKFTLATVPSAFRLWRFSKEFATSQSPFEAYSF